MNELMKLAKGNSIAQEKKPSLDAMQQRLGVTTLVQQGSSIELIALVFDATGSMDPIWSEAKKNIRKLVERLRELTPHAKLVLVAYRDYCDGNQILEVSPQTTDVDKLMSFLESIDCDGGGDTPEAVEVALEKIIDLKPSLAILVGDAPPHGVMDSFKHGKDYRDYARTLGNIKIPVYTISTDQLTYTISSFREIAELSGGKSFLLSEVDQLIDLLSVVTAKRASRLDDLAGIFKRENNGSLTDTQKRLLIEAAKT